ncbi:hypothetical protein [Planococcus shixiaomingii]|uniref:hypothetical protein n=1 Tax=Planococcus shixiaomingii TaxID=3058393 RepID=UPI002633A837|nr:hypothetical protein [Planococcus sp. N022]WKA54642.1 hypothetical protein QWY21_18560 [Planococcus sp. N022]
MIYLLRATIATLLTILGFYMISILLLFTVGDSDEILLYTFGVVIVALLIVIINQLAGINGKLEKNRSIVEPGKE